MTTTLSPLPRLAMTLPGFLLLTAVASAQPRAEDVEPLDWGKTPNVTRLGSLYFAGQVDQEGIENAKEAGVELVLNLRHPDELEWNEEEAIEQLGLRYENVPVTGDSFSSEAFAKIEKLVAENDGKKILIHCGSSNRVGGWFATHLVTQKGMTLEEAISIGRKAGMTSRSIESRARKYVEQHP